MSNVRPVFLLSPAHCGGKRAQLLMNPLAQFELATRLRGPGATLGEVFTFLSGLYFRGKIAYAEAFGRELSGPGSGGLVITPGWGLVPARHTITLEDLHAIAAVGVAPAEARFRDPLARDASALALRLEPGARVVLLGSIATGKYVDVLESVLGGRLRFPADFVGRGDMSRGGLMLRRVREDRELEYIPIAGAVRRGPRPPRLGLVQ
jgi:hypothetical protein